MSDEEAAAMEVDPYTEDAYYDDLMRVTEDLADPDMALTLVRESQATVRWMRDRGVRWIPMFGRQAYKVGGKFRFWGRYTYGAPPRERAHQRITRFEAGREIAFEWEIEGIESEVIFVLEPLADESGADKTRLALRHKFPCPPAVPYPTELVEDMWHLMLGNLRAYLRGHELVRPDFTDPAPEIRVSIEIDAPRERVFRALLDPAALNAWIATGAEVEPRVGGRYRYGWNYKMAGRDVQGGPTKILELVENERIVTDWPDWRGDESRGSTRVAWILESLGPSRTRVARRAAVGHDARRAPARTASGERRGEPAAERMRAAGQAGACAASAASRRNTRPSSTSGCRPRRSARIGACPGRRQRSSGTPSGQDGRNGAQQDPGVEPHRPLAHVFDVELDHPLQADFRAPGHLPEPCDPLRDDEPLEVMRLEELRLDARRLEARSRIPRGLKPATGPGSDGVRRRMAT